jgi:hypothetical protein
VAPRGVRSATARRLVLEPLPRRELLPLLAAFCALVAASLLAVAVLHALGADRIGRYLGIAGSLLILASFGYSLRKRRSIRFGPAAVWLRLHERMAWVGCLLVLVHAGMHVNAILAWLALGAMLINVASGLTGKLLLERARRRLLQTRVPTSQGPLVEPIEERMHWESLAFDIVKQWRVVHLPITLIFAVLAAAHIVAALLFWGWR